MIKFRILAQSEFRQGEAHLFEFEGVESNGESCDRYQPSVGCQGNGNRLKLVGLRELANFRRVDFTDYPAGFSSEWFGVFNLNTDKHQEAAYFVANWQLL